jgi:hypothetical protein
MNIIKISTHLHKSQYLQPLAAEISDGMQASLFAIPGSENDTITSEIAPTVKNSTHITEDIEFTSAYAFGAK